MDKKLEISKQRIQKILIYSTWVLVAILAVSTIKNINKVINIRKQVEQEQLKVEKMQAENKELQDQILEAQSQEFIDKQIRNRLGLTKEGEAIVILPDEEIVKRMAPDTEEDGKIYLDPNWKKWVKLFI